MRSTLSKDFIRLLKAIDDELGAEQSVTIIGGAAILLGYHVPVATRDIDTMSSTKVLMRAYERATVSTGLPIPFGVASVADAPYSYEERLRLLRHPKLRHLRVFVPEKHDLALMKTIRGDRRDYDALVQLHKKVHLSRRTLEKRFRDEMDHVIGEPRRLRLNFQRLLELLFD